MAYDLQEQEQIEALKGWWKQNGKLVILAVFAAVVAFAGVSGWRYYKDRQAERASQLYAELEKASQGDARKIGEVAGQIVEQYGRTAYGPMAALVAAKAAVDAGDLKSAGTHLTWALEHAKDDETRAVARLRLAAVRLDEKQHDEALKLLEQQHPESFAGLYADLRGDVMVAQGKVAEARAAYKQALDKLAPEATYRLIVQAKLDGIGGVN